MTTAMMALSIGGGLIKGVASKQAADANAATMESNAVLAHAAGVDSLARGGQEAGRARMRGTSREASQVSDYSASGIDIRSGSAADVISSTEAVSEFEAQTAKSNAAREAWGYESRASDLRRQAQYTRQEGNMAEVTSILGGVVSGASYLRPRLKVS